MPGFEDSLIGRVYRVEHLADSTLIILEMTEGIENILGSEIFM